MKFFSLSALFVIASCANIKHATNANIQDFKSFEKNQSERDYWNKKVSEIKKGEETSCKLLGEIKGSDNAFDQGPEYAVLYMKVNAFKEYKANAILVEGNEKVGNYGSQAFGKAYQCGASASR